jgi:glycosyltransferase involved in cell wall biosynthesis
MESKNVLWMGFSPATTTGQGLVGRKVCTYLKKEGHDVTAFCALTKHGEMTVETMLGEPAHGLRLIGHANSPWGQELTPYMIERYKPDDIVTLGDIWNYHWLLEKQKLGADYRFLAHITYDTENHVAGLWDPLPFASDVPIALSKFGGKMMTDLGIKSEYMPHGVDTKTFTPVNHSQKQAIREEFGLPKDATLGLFVGMNQIRKKLDRTIAAFAASLRAHPNQFLMMFSHPRSDTGWDCIQIAKNYGICDKLLWPRQMLEIPASPFIYEAELAKYYQAADYYIHLNGGAGFDIPIIEAMSCALPTITTAYCTGPEFLGEKDEKGGIVNKRGYLVPAESFEHHPTGGLWALASIREAAASINKVLTDQERTMKMAQAARRFAVENYDWDDVILPMWKKLIESNVRYDNRPKGKKPTFVTIT